MAVLDYDVYVLLCPLSNKIGHKKNIDELQPMLVTVIRRT